MTDHTHDWYDGINACYAGNFPFVYAYTYLEILDETDLEAHV